MKCIDISFDFDAVKMNDREREVVRKQGFGFSFEMLLNQAVQSKYPNGTDRQKSKTLSRIQKALDSLTTEDTWLKVEEAEFDFIKEVFLDDNFKVQPIQNRLVSALLNHIEEAASSTCCTKEKGACTEKAEASSCNETSCTEAVSA